jgi:hypothetical protein
MEQQVIKGKNNTLWIKQGANYTKGKQIDNSILDETPDWQIVKEYTVEGWFRYDDEKDFITQTIHATTPARAEKLFRSKYKRNFFKVDIDLI